MNATLLNDLRLLVSELFKYRTPLISVFVVISFSVLGVGLVLPKVYQSYAMIQVNENDIIQPLMKGSAVATSIADVSRNAKSLINSRRILLEVLKDTGHITQPVSPAVEEKLIEKISQRTEVSSVGQNLIKISYRDRDPLKAQKGAQRFAELFLSESRTKKNDESQSAFEFIDKQVESYHAKLLEAEKKLKEFRSAHMDARPGTEAQISEQLNRLQRQLETAKLDQKEERIRYESLERQLSGEAETISGLTRESQLQTRIGELQSELDTLRLTYTDTYPDVVQKQHQIEDLRNELAAETVRKKTAKADKNGKRERGASVTLNPQYQQLRTSLSESKTKLATLTARIEETKKTIDAEILRGKKLHGGEAELSELTRDYEVNRDIYQDLLKRRENARVSKNLESGTDGRLALYESAFLPVKPTGIRFLHFMLAGLVLGVLIPVGLFYVFQQADPRIRSIEIIREEMQLPVLAVMPVLATPADIRIRNKNIRNLGLALILTVCFYFAIGLLRFTGVI